MTRTLHDAVRTPGDRIAEAEGVPAGRILVVDDEPGMRDMLGYTLTARGYAVATAPDGPRALDRLRKERFDLVISDVCMPGMNGIDLMDGIRRLAPGAEILVVTAYATVSMAVDAMKNGAFDFLMKPVDEVRLAEIVRHALRSGEVRSELALYKSSLALFQSVELASVLPVIVNQACQILSADYAAILTRDGRIHAAARSSDLLADRALAALLSAACARCDGSSRGVVLVPGDDAELASKAGAAGALLIQPLVSGGSGLGYLAAARAVGDEPFSESDLHRAVLFATQAAQAVQNARLFHELRATQRQLLQSQKLGVAGRLAAGIAHEINTPLNCIYGNVQMALEEEGLPADVRKGLEGVVGQVRHCRDVVIDLLEFVRPRRFKREVHALHPLLESALTIACLESPKPPTIARVWPERSPSVRVDPVQVKQIIVNLVRNALQSMKGREPYGVTLRVAESDGRVRIMVEDRGPGIAPRNLGRLFEAFFTTKSSGEGTGLGLYLCELMAERNGGSVTARNREEGGAVFTLELPSASREAGAARRAP